MQINVLSLSENDEAILVFTQLFMFQNRWKGRGVVFRWLVPEKAGDCTLVTFNIVYDPYPEHHKMHWLVAIDRNIFLCIDRFNLLVGRRIGWDEEFCEVGDHSNDLDILIGSLADVINNSLLGVAACLPKSMESHWSMQLQDLIKHFRDLRGIRLSGEIMNLIEHFRTARLLPAFAKFILNKPMELKACQSEHVL